MTIDLVNGAYVAKLVDNGVSVSVPAGPGSGDGQMILSCGAHVFNATTDLVLRDVKLRVCP